MSMISGMQSDTTKIIADWTESISVERYSTTYDNLGSPTKTWAEQDTGDVDIQVLSGSSVFELEKLNIKSTHRIICEYDLDVQFQDRIKSGSDYYYVDYIKTYEDHLTLYATKRGN